MTGLDEAQFDKETGGIQDPVDLAPGEVLPPGQAASGAEESTTFADFLSDDLVAEIFGLPGAVMARKTGEEYWQISPEEKRVLGAGGGPAVRYLVQKYLTEQSGPVAALGAALGVVYAPKLIRYQMELKEKKEREKQMSRQSSPVESPSSSDSRAAENPPSSSVYQEHLDVS